MPIYPDNRILLDALNRLLSGQIPPRSRSVTLRLAVNEVPTLTVEYFVVGDPAPTTERFTIQPIMEGHTHEVISEA